MTCYIILLKIMSNHDVIPRIFSQLCKARLHMQHLNMLKSLTTSLDSSQSSILAFHTLLATRDSRAKNTWNVCQRNQKNDQECQLCHKMQTQMHQTKCKMHHTSTSTKTNVHTEVSDSSLFGFLQHVNENKKYRLAKWRVLCQPKSEEGLGHDLRIKNVSPSINGYTNSLLSIECGSHSE